MPNYPSMKLAEGSTEPVRYDEAGKCYPELNFRLFCSWCSQKRTGLVIKTLTQMQPSSGCNFPHKWEEVIGLHTLWGLSLFWYPVMLPFSREPDSLLIPAPGSVLLWNSWRGMCQCPACWLLRGVSGAERGFLPCRLLSAVLCCLSFPHLLAEVQQRKWRKVYGKKIWSNLDLSLWNPVCTGSFLCMMMITGNKMIVRKWSLVSFALSSTSSFLCNSHVEALTCLIFFLTVRRRPN